MAQTPQSLLVLEPSLPTLQLLRTRLAEQKFAVHGVQHPEEALDWLHANAPVTAVVLSLESQKCFDFLERLKEVPGYAQTHVLGITAKPSRDILSHVHKLGVECILAKPFPLPTLTGRIKELLCPSHRLHGAFDPLILRIFLESTIHVFELTASIPLYTGKPFLKTSNVATNEVSAVIGLASSQVKGSMALNLDKEILIKALNRMLGPQNPEALDQAALNDVCGELANQVAGRAKQTFLREKNMTFEITVPTIVSGKDHMLNYKSGTPILSIPFSYEKKQNIYVEFSLEINENPVDTPSEEKLTVAVEEGQMVLF